MSSSRLSYLRGTGLTPGRSTKTLSSTRLRRKGRKKERKKERRRERERKRERDLLNDRWWGGGSLTIEGQVSKQSSQEVHGVHDSNGDVGYLLHLFLGGAEIREYCHVMSHTPAHRNTHIAHTVQYKPKQPPTKHTLFCTSLNASLCFGDNHVITFLQGYNILVYSCTQVLLV